MPTLGTTQRDRTYSTGANYGNVIADGILMPEKGWITGFKIHAGGFEAPVHARLAAWDRPDGAILYAGAEETWAPGAAWQEVDGLAIPVDQGKEPAIGFWRDKAEPSMFSVQTQGRGSRQVRVQTYTAAREIPTLGTFDPFDGILSAELTYTAQERPLAPVFLAPTPEEGDVANLSLAVACTLPHGRDAAYDSTDRVQVRVVRRDTNAVHFDQWVEVDVGVEEFSYTIPNLLATNLPYKLLARQQDTWGSNSEWAEVDFQSSNGPDAPVMVGPLERIIVQKPTEFRGTYANPLFNAFSRAQVEIWNTRRTTRLQASGDQVATGSVVLGGEWAIGSTWMTNLAWGKKYAGRARTKDTAGNYGGWTWFEFWTNSAPRVFDLKPAGGRLTANKILKVSLDDPEGDAITSVDYRVYRKSTGALVVSGAMTIDANGKSASIDPGVLILSDIAYKWDARASDGSAPSPSAYTAQQEFTWAPVPDVSLFLPTEDAPHNLVDDPSFEYASSSWSTFAESAGNTIVRIKDADSFVGAWSLRGVVTNAGGSSPIRRSGFKAVDPARAYYFSARLKRELLSPPAVTFFGVEAYNSAGTLLATLFPGNMPNGVDVGTAYTERSGFVGAAAQGYATTWPTDTTQMRLVFEPSRGVASAVRLDAVQAQQLKALTTYLQTQSGAAWLGYFDGDTASQRDDTTDFEWEGISGASESRGIPVLEYPLTNVILSYVPPGGSLKSNDRTYIERWVRGRWRDIYDSNWAGGGRTTIPLPTGLFRNKDTYRLKVEARDSATTPRIGSTEWVVFQTDYEGPTPPPILEAAGSPEKATLRLSWARTSLSELSFGGYEIGIAPYARPDSVAVVELLGNPDQTEYTWHEPVSQEDYYLMVRQIENVAGEQIAGAWSRAYASVDYRKWFLKDLEAPAEYAIGFDLMAEDVVSVDYPKEATELMQWGETKPVFYPDAREQATGSVVLRLKRGDPNLAVDEAAIKAIKARRHIGAILMTTDPSEVYYVYLDTMTEEYSDLPWHSSWTIGFKEVAYESDYYLREGVTRGTI